MSPREHLERHQREYRKAIQAVAYKYFVDPDDLGQDVAERLLRVGKIDGGVGGFTAYVVRVANNVCIDRYRRGRKAQFSGLEDTEVPVGEVMRLDNRREAAKLLWGLRRYWGRRNARIMWMMGRGWKYEELAVEMGMPSGTVKGLIRRMRTWVAEGMPVRKRVV